MIFKLWTQLSRLPAGKSIFNFILGVLVPYSGSILPEVLSFHPGEVTVKMKDRRKLRNHLRSIHAVALMNLGELTSGLAVVSKIPKDARAIVTRLEIDFKKKARGPLISSSHFDQDFQQITEPSIYTVTANIRNQDHETVAEVKATWLIGPKEV